MSDSSKICLRVVLEVFYARGMLGRSSDICGSGGVDIQGTEQPALKTGFLIFHEGASQGSTAYLCPWSHRFSSVYQRGGPAGEGVEVKGETKRQVT